MLLKCIEVPVLPKLWIYAQLRTLKQEVNDNFGMRCCWLGLVSFFLGGGVGGWRIVFSLGLNRS